VPRSLSLLHAADVAQALILAAARGSRVPPSGNEGEEPGTPGYYFAACDEHPTHYQLGRLIGRALGRRRAWTIPFGPPIVWLVGGVGELAGKARGRQVVFNLDKAREATAGSWVCSPNKAREELGFAVQAPLPDRLRQTADWYRKQGWL
jgi:nucleoside-diphosphate-sugar epimerase